MERQADPQQRAIEALLAWRDMEHRRYIQGPEGVNARLRLPALTSQLKTAADALAEDIMGHPLRPAPSAQPAGPEQMPLPRPGPGASAAGRGLGRLLRSLIQSLSALIAAIAADRAGAAGGGAPARPPSPASAPPAEPTGPPAGPSGTDAAVITGPN